MSVKKTLGRVGGYFVGTASQAAISFISVPLLIHSLGIAEFGRWGVVEPLVQLAAQLTLLGVNLGIVKLVCQDGFKPKNSFFLLAKATLPMLGVICSLTLIASQSVGFSLTSGIFLALLVAAESYLMLALAGMRAGNIVTGFVAASLLKALGVLGVLLCNRKFGFPIIQSAENVVIWWGGISSVSLLIAVLSLYYFDRGNDAVSTSSELGIRHIYADCVRYGLPMLISSLLMLAVLNIDRFFLQHYLDFRQVGEYVVYVKIANAMNFLIMPVQLWWPTARFTNISSEDGGAKFFSFAATAICRVFLMGAMGLWLLSPWLYGVFTQEGHFNKWLALLPILGSFIYAMATPLNVGLLKSGNTHFNIVAVGVSALFSMLLCFLLIPLFGLIGAALATVAANIVNVVGLNLLSQHFHRVPFNYGKMTAFVIVFTLCSVFYQTYMSILPIFGIAVIYSLMCAGLLFYLYRREIVSSPIFVFARR